MLRRNGYDVERSVVRFCQREGINIKELRDLAAKDAADRGRA
jgi:hypothetical protein